MSAQFRVCSECGQFGGEHFSGCPEDGGSDDDEAPLVCRSCGRDETEIEGKITVELVGPICPLCMEDAK